jgi:hypothetical protein
LSHRPTIAANLLEVKPDGTRLNEKCADDQGILQGHLFETHSASCAN